MKTKTYIVSFPHTFTRYHRNCYDHQQEYESSHDLEKSVTGDVYYGLEKTYKLFNFLSLGSFT